MSILETAQQRAGIMIVADTMPKGQRQVKSFQKLWNETVRAVSDFQKEHGLLTIECRKLQSQVIKQAKELVDLKTELAAIRMRRELEMHPELTSEDRTAFLGCLPSL
jgi:hypothetical protein